MFYEERQIHNLLKCPNCKGNLDDARLLPCCEETICHNCLENYILDKTKNTNRYKCIVCKNVSELPEHRHFPHNKFISKIASEHPKEVYRSELVENLKIYIRNFENNKQSMYKFVDDGVTLLKDHCDNIKNEVNKTSQAMITNIQACCEEYMHRIHKYEIETTIKLEQIKEVAINKSIKASDEFNKRWTEYLNNSMISTSEIQTALQQGEDLDFRLQKESNSMKSLLFDGVLIYEPDKNLLTFKEILGPLKLIDKKDEKKVDDIVCTRTLTGHKEWIRCIRRLSKNGNTVASGSDDYMIKIWNLETGECIKTLRGHEDSITCFEMYDEKLISGSWDGLIKIWDLKKNECIQNLEGHTYRVSNLKMYGNRLVSSSWDCQIKVWEIATGKCIRTLKGHTSVIYCLEMCGDILLSGSVDKSIKCWSLTPKGTCLRTLNGHTAGVTDIKLNSVKDTFISSSFDGTIKIWHLKEARCLHTLTGHLKGVFCLKLLSNDRLVSGSLDATIKIWNMKNYDCFRTLSSHLDFVLCFELVDKMLLSGSADKTIKIWEV